MKAFLLRSVTLAVLAAAALLALFEFGHLGFLRSRAFIVFLVLPLLLLFLWAVKKAVEQNRK